MSNVNVVWAPNQIDFLLLGTSGGGMKYTVVRGQPIFIGTDGDGHTNRVIPTSTIANHAADGISLMTTAETAYTNGACLVALWPVNMLTDNVDPTNPPESTADKFVYILDAGTFSDADGGSSGHSYGQCYYVGATDGLYGLNLTGVDET